MTQIAAHVGHSRTSLTLDTYAHVLSTSDRQCKIFVRESVQLLQVRARDEIQAAKGARWGEEGRAWRTLLQHRGGCSVLHPWPLVREG